MNPFLAELYNTARNVGTEKTASDDTEKLAQAAVLDQMLQNEGISIDALSAGDLVKVATEIFGADSAIVKGAGEMPPQFMNGGEEKKEEEKKEEEKEKEAAEKMAEADFLGRQMAHAYVDELSKIEKQAQVQQTKTASAQASGPIAAVLSKIKSASANAQPQVQAPSNGTTKQASAIDMLARQRAEEMLKQAGISTQATPEAQLEAAVQRRANEMLKEAGYQVG